MKFDEIDEKSRELIIGTMDRWLAGEAVWPLARILKNWDGVFQENRWMREAFSEKAFAREMEIFMLRHLWVDKFGFAIPCAELVEVLRQHAPILDVGAGTGYMTKLMRNAGIEASGTDPFDNEYTFKRGLYDNEQLRLEGKTAVKKIPHTVFCSWPTYAHTWFRQMLKAMRPGRRLIVIRESATAEETAWAYLDTHFTEEQTLAIPCWPHMHDRCEVWIKTK